jgi:predicted Zn-dependent protease
MKNIARKVTVLRVSKLLGTLFMIMASLPWFVACKETKGDASSKLHSSGKRVYLVAIGGLSEDRVQRLVAYYQDKFKVDINFLQTIPLNPSDMDSARKQLVGEKAIESMRAAFPDLAKDPTAILIGVSATDMYIAAKDWRFAFGLRDEALHAAVVSSARMDTHYPGEPAGVGTPETRTRKMVTKDIGILYYGLPVSDNSHSVLYGQIGGIEELDAVGEDF